MMQCLDPIASLRKKADYAEEEIRKDTPLIALSCPEGIYLATYSGSTAHHKIVGLCKEEGVLVLLAGIGQASDLVILKDQLRKFAVGFSQYVHEKDISGRLMAPTATEFLRKYFEERPRPLAVQVAIVDAYDLEQPVCAISFSGKVEVGKNMLLDGSGMQVLKVRFKTIAQMKTYARLHIKRVKVAKFQSFSYRISKEELRLRNKANRKTRISKKKNKK